MGGQNEDLNRIQQDFIGKKNYRRDDKGKHGRSKNHDQSVFRKDDSKKDGNYETSEQGPRILIKMISGKMTANRLAL